MNITEARASIMANLVSCPVCGAALFCADKSDNLEVAEFVCEAAFYLQPGSIIAVSRICAAPSTVAIRHLEMQAAQLAGKEAA